MYGAAPLYTNLALGIPAEQGYKRHINKTQILDTLFLCTATCWRNGVASSGKDVRMTFDVHFGSLEDK